MDATPPPPLLLAAVAAVCATSAACAPLDHVARVIDSFLDPSLHLSPQQAVASGSVRLLQRVLFRLCDDDGSVDVFLQQLHLRKAMREAAMRGEMAMVELLHARHPQFLAANALALAAERGDLEMIQWLETHRPDESRKSLSDALNSAAGYGHLEVVRYLMESYDSGTTTFYCPSRVLESAIANGHIQIAEFLSSHGVRSSRLGLAVTMAVDDGRLSALQYVHALGQSEAFSSSDSLETAARRGNLEVVRFLHANGADGNCGTEAMDEAASGGFLDVVQFLHDNRTEGCTAQAVVGAAENGHLHILQWFHTHLPRTLRRAIKPTTVAALAYGQDEVLAWLQSQFRSMAKHLPRDVAETVAMADNLAGLKKLHELQGPSVCVWSSRVLEGAALHGNVEMIQWLHEHRPEMHSPEAMDVAAERGHFEIVRLLHEYGMAECTPSTLARAAGTGDLALVQWVDAHCTVERNVKAAIEEAAGKGHLAVVQWFHDHDHYQHDDGWSVEVMDRAAMRGDLEMVIWLHINRSEGCTTRALDQAAAINEWELVQWLVHNRSEGATQQAMDDAAVYDNLDIVLLLHDRYGLRMSEDAVFDVALRGDLSGLRWAYSVQPETVDLVACRDLADEYGQFHVLDWIDDTRGERGITRE